MDTSLGVCTPPFDEKASFENRPMRYAILRVTRNGLPVKTQTKTGAHGYL